MSWNQYWMILHTINFSHLCLRHIYTMQPSQYKEKSKKSRKVQGTMWNRFRTLNHSACGGRKEIASCSVSFSSVWACAVCSVLNMCVLASFMYVCCVHLSPWGLQARFSLQQTGDTLDTHTTQYVININIYKISIRKDKSVEPNSNMHTHSLSLLTIPIS